MKKYLVMIALCFVNATVVVADNKTDSLKHALKTFPPSGGTEGGADTTRIKTLNRLSEALWRTGEYKKALHYANKALNSIVIASHADGSGDGAKQSPEIKHKLKKAKAAAYTNIGIIYDLQGNYPKALEHYRRSLKLKRQLNDKAGIATSYTNIGSLYTTLPDSVPGISPDSTERLYERAMELQQKSLHITKEIGAAEVMTWALNGIGVLYLKSAPLNPKPPFNPPKGGTEEGGTYHPFSHPDYEKAIAYYEQSSQIADSIGAKPQMVEAYEGLWKGYKQLSKHPPAHLNRGDCLARALEYHELYLKVKEEIFNKEKNKELGRQEMAHEYELEQIEQQQREEAAAKAKASLHLRYYWVITAFLVVLFGGILFSGLFAIGEKTAKNVVFVGVVFLFEFILVLIDPLIDQYTGGNPALTLATNSAIALLMIPVHNFLVNKLVGRVSKTSVGRRKIRRRAQ